MRELHLFAGIGGGILAGELLGHTCVGAVELDPYCREVLRARQVDGALPPFPIHDDVRTFDGAAWLGRVDVVCGGFPCQDISLAGSGAGLAGDRSGLWFEMLRVVRDVAPAYVFVENSWALVRRGLGTVLEGLAALGFDAEWAVLGASDVGACHRRRRLWILAAHRDRGRREMLGLEEPAGQQCAQRREPDGRSAAAAPAADTDGCRCESQIADLPARQPDAARSAPADAGRAVLEEWHRTQRERAHAAAGGSRWWPTVRPLRGADDGPADTMDRTARLTAIGNAQVPLQAAAAFRTLMQRLNR